MGKIKEPNIFISVNHGIKGTIRNLKTGRVRIWSIERNSLVWGDNRYYYWYSLQESVFHSYSSP